MNKNNGLIIFSAILCASGTCAYGSDSVHDESRNAILEGRKADPRYEVIQALSEKCRRQGVVWSGGIATRFSDRISPRPIRSRWERDGDRRIRCEGVDAFERRRVSDQPWIR